ncbi:MAG: membrane protein insertase YidC [Candidatus Magasanikbacteria bacterium]|nr:membrane protein insertase YidC [Candidatus Magasanikbacteria bacterium]
MISSLFNIILYKPIFNLFVGLYNILPGHDLGVVIFVLTVLVRLALYPLTTSSIKAQKSMQELQPKMEAIKKDFPNDKQKQAEATMALYKTHKVNPLTSCLPMLVQLPLLIALFWVLRDGLASQNLGANLYSFVRNPGTLNPLSLGSFDLAKPSIALSVLAGLAQFFQAKTLTRKKAPKEAGAGGKDEDMAAMMNKQMLYVMPVMTVLIGFKFPAGLTLYWFLSTALMLAQQLFMFRKGDEPGAPKADTKVIEGKIIS